MAEPILYLTFVGGQKDGQTLRLVSPQVIVGRDPHCDVPLDFYNNPEISSRHASIVRHGHGFTINDSSLNGTYVNGQRITGPTQLSHCDLLQFGTAGPEMRVGVGQPPPGARAPTAGPQWSTPAATIAQAPGPRPATVPQQAARPGGPGPTTASRMTAVGAAPHEASSHMRAAGAVPTDTSPVPSMPLGNPFDTVSGAETLIGAPAPAVGVPHVAPAAPAAAGPALASALKAMQQAAEQAGVRSEEAAAPATLFMQASPYATVAEGGTPRPSIRMIAAGGPAPRLRVERVDQPGYMKELTGETFRIGKDPRAEISFASERGPKAAVVDDQHAKIVFLGGEFVLADTDSHHRTYMNGRPISRVPLRGGEVVTFGENGPQLRFTLLEAVPRPQPKATMLGQAVVTTEAGADGGASEVQIGGGRTFAMPGAAAVLAQQLTAKRNQARLLKEIPLKGKPLEIGRLGGLDLTLDSIQVSKRHARLEWRQVPGQAEPVPFIVDQKTANGTYVKGQLVKEAQIKPGDDITIGPFLLQIEGKTLRVFDFRQASVSCHQLTRQDPKTKRVFLDKVSLVIRPSEFVVFLGPSGSGKSTLLKTLTGAEPPQGGHVYVNDTDFYANYQRLKQSVGYVPQEDIVHNELTVRRTLEYAAQLRLPKELDEAGRQKRIEEVLSILELTAHAHKPVAKLSGGQRKRVSIGVELLTEPGMLYLDEPTSGLDANLEGKMMLLFRELSLRGNTVVCVTHHLDNVHLADKVGIMFDGKLVFFGAPAEALEHFKCTRMAEIFERLGEVHDAEALRNEYFGSEYYARHLAAEVLLLDMNKEKKPEASKKEEKPPQEAGAGAISQFFILSRRYLEILTRDLKNTLILLLQAPIVAGVICIAIPTSVLVRNPTSTLLLVLCLSALWFGTSNAAREITKEQSIFARERMVSLKIIPYVASKFFVLQLFSLFQCVLMQLIVLRFANTPSIRFIGTEAQPWLLSLANIYLLSLSGIGLGLLISAFAGNSDKAMSLVPIVLIPQILLSGGFGLFRQGSPVRPVAYAMSLNWALDNAKRIALCPLGEKGRCFACLTPTDPDIEEADPVNLPKQLRVLKEELPTRCIADSQRTKSETTEIVMTGLYGEYRLAPEGKPRTKVDPYRGFGVLGGMSVLFFLGVSIALRAKSR